MSDSIVTKLFASLRLPKNGKHQVCSTPTSDVRTTNHATLNALNLSLMWNLVRQSCVRSLAPAQYLIRFRNESPQFSHRITFATNLETNYPSSFWLKDLN